MFNRLLFTFATAACLTGAFAVYAVLTRPLVDVPDLPATSADTTRHAIAHRPAENVRVAETYLSEQSWAAQSQYMLRSGQTFIYTQKWEHDEGDPRIRFFPFAMVWLQKDKEGRETAMSLVSDSAQLKFASAFDEFNPNPGRVVGALLDGDVQVKGPDGLAIVGKQFVFDESAPSLISTNPVQFQYGSHYGRGRTLNMKLIPAEGPPGRDRPHVSGVRTIRLGSGTDPSEYVRLNVRLPQQGQPGRGEPRQEEQKPVKIQCSGDLEYDVAMRTASFSKSVRAYRWTGATDFDALDCDELWLQFEPVPAKSVATAVANAGTPEHHANAGGNAESKPEPDPAGAGPRPYQHVDTDLTFRRLIATGKLVVVRSTQNDLRAQMNRLDYDAIDRRLLLNDPRGVYVLYNDSALTVPAVDIRFRADNSLQEVLCQGTGRLERIGSETNDTVFVATWAGRLRKSTDPANGLDLIELQRQAYISQPRSRTALGAESIRLWLEPMGPIALGVSTGPGDSAATVNGTADTASTDNTSADKTTAGNPAKPPPEVQPQPKWLIAEQHVALVSPKLEARTDQLEVRFIEQSTAPREIGLLPRNGFLPASLEVQTEPVAERRSHAAQSPPKPRTGDGPATGSAANVRTANAVAGQPERGSLGPPIDVSPGTDGKLIDGKSGGGARGADSFGNSAEPLDVKADQIRVSMLRIEGQPEPELVEVETEGRVKVVQRRSPGEAPMTCEGSRLRLQNRGKLREIVHLFGQPAHLRAGGLHIEGREVHLDRETNRVWVKGSGLLQLPVPPGTRLESLGTAINDPDLDVWWQESMDFDGRTAKFIGKVRAELGLSRMHCEQMDVKLSSTLSFTDPAPDESAEPELSSVHCREDVTFENSDYEGNKLTRVQRGRVAEFTVERLKGTSFAQGPGQLLVWQRGRGSQTGLTPHDTIQANRPIGTVSSEWDFTRVDFKGRMTGHIEPQRSTFHDSILIVHGPVALPNEAIDPDHLPPLANSMRCEKLEFAHQSKGPDQPKGYQQLVGWGNARIEGRGFYANADEISFDGSKGLYMLRAHGNQSAMIAQDTDQGTRREASGRRIEFIPSTRTVKVDWANGATGSP
jgi:hypothetical protein